VQWGKESLYGKGPDGELSKEFLREKRGGTKAALKKTGNIDEGKSSTQRKRRRQKIIKKSLWRKKDLEHSKATRGGKGKTGGGGSLHSTRKG